MSRLTSLTDIDDFEKVVNEFFTSKFHEANSISSALNSNRTEWQNAVLNGEAYIGSWSVDGNVYDISIIGMDETNTKLVFEIIDSAGRHTAIEE